ncbi:hypothetical protein FRC04_008629 [Tulasnella sp. 424]|nr:hypothetical protein FRC04_008629 [Tulasnella sp. 424]KAG8970760.1 hypothetical protein FRC05_011711 [Tulasnella sp. 425]
MSSSFNGAALSEGNPSLSGVDPGDSIGAGQWGKEARGPGIQQGQLSSTPSPPLTDQPPPSAPICPPPN